MFKKIVLSIALLSLKAFSLESNLENNLNYTPVTSLLTDLNLASSFELKDAFEKAKNYTLQNISPAGTAPGCIVASPSKSNPDYFYDWVRDGALVMDNIVSLYETETNATEKQKYEQIIYNYILWVSHIQKKDTPSGTVAEPKFYVTGEPYREPWGRPQSDGPALRALTLIRFSEILMKQGDPRNLLPVLYNSNYPATSAIKIDLEYVSNHWQETSFDLWEEVSGQHFYNFLIQRKVLIKGAWLASVFKDKGAADWYLKQSQIISSQIKNFFDPFQKIIKPTINRDKGIDYKNTNLDIAVILALIHSKTDENDLITYTNEYVLSSVSKLIQAFGKIYDINSKSLPGIALGRYPEDRYDGVGNSVGNPWFIATHALGEFLINHVSEIDKKKTLTFNESHILFYKSVFATLNKSKPFAFSAGQTIAQSSIEFYELKQSLIEAAKNQFLRTKTHTENDFRLSEQFSKSSGFKLGARDLTWSYTSLMTFLRSLENICTNPYRFSLSSLCFSRTESFHAKVSHF